jgi:hypothetical protein
VPLEILIDLDDEKRAAAVDPGGNVLGAAQVGLALKDAGAVQAGEQAIEAALWSWSRRRRRRC